MTHILCYNCASPLEAGVRFCTECGAEVLGTMPLNQTQPFGAGHPSPPQEPPPLPGSAGDFPSPQPPPFRQPSGTEWYASPPAGPPGSSMQSTETFASP